MVKQIYLDNSATTPLHPNVQKVVKENLENFANPSSKHFLGREMKEKIENARREIANTINAQSEEIYFTSCATESNNWAIKGLADANPQKKHIITSEIEHPAILEVCKSLEEKGYKITYIKVDKEGIVDVNEIKKSITKDTLLVSIMHVNNEIGTIQPIEEIAKVCKSKKVYFHTDAVQSYLKLKIDVKKTPIDLLSISGHKINAPKGIGFLYIKNGTKISPILNGGGQERNLRGGTENTLGILALAEATKIKRDSKSIQKSRDKLLSEILKIKGAKLNGSKSKRIFHNINVSFYGIEGESLLMLLEQDGILVSTGSACSSNKLSHSHVLEAIKTEPLYLNGSIRITLDEISDDEIKFIAEKIKQNVEKLQQLSPFKIK